LPKHFVSLTVIEMLGERQA